MSHKFISSLADLKMNIWSFKFSINIVIILFMVIRFFIY